MWTEFVGASPSTFTLSASNAPGLNTPGTYPFFCKFHSGMTGSIVVTAATGTKNAFAVNLNVTSFPNPFTESATVEFELEKSASVKVEIYNMQGQKEYTS